MGKLQIIKCKSCSEIKLRNQFRLDKKGHLKERVCLPCNIKQVRQYDNRGYNSYRPYKKDYCEACGFKGHFSQLDVDHIDGNHKNHDSSNLMTLCANCHRLKTYQERQKSLL